MTDASKGRDQDSFRIVEADRADATPADRCPWKRQAIYRSPICVVIHLSVMRPDCRNTAEVEAAKMALFRYLRQVHQAVMDHGIILPLAAVIEAPQHSAKTLLAKALEGWGGDQTWHRGGFTLYLENPGHDVQKRLRDLLNPTGDVMNDLGTAITRDQSWFAARLYEKRTTFEDGSQTQSAELAGICAERLAPDSPYNGASDQFSALTDWRSKALEKARNTAAGGGRA